MSSSHWINFIYGGASILSGIVSKVTKITGFIISVNKQNDSMNEILFYGSDSDENNRKMGLNNLFCIYYVITQATETVDVCVPTLKSETISKCLLHIHQKNHTKVRIVVHNSEDLQIFKPFVDCGIEVKTLKSEVKLGHEFVLVDANCREAVAIIGSLDYEVSRVNCNRDSTLLTSEKALVSVLKREFDRIWTLT